MKEHILESRAAGVFYLQISRPEKKNALTQEMYAALSDGLRRADADDSIFSIILCGLDGCFTSGNDLAGFKDGAAADGNYPHNLFLDVLVATSKPVIAAVSGLSLGIGTILLLHCDFVYATPDSRFSLPFVKLGLSPEGATSHILPRVIGHQRAAEIMMLGEMFSAETANEIGFVNKVVPDSLLLETARVTAAKLAACPQGSILQVKALLKSGQIEVVRQRRMDELVVFNERLNSSQVKNAIEAFYDQRSKKIGQG